MKILIAGSSGMIGTALRQHFSTHGHEVLRLVRRNPDRQAGEFRWDPLREEIDTSAFDGVEVVINVAGENIGTGRWTRAKRRRIRESRVGTTGLLARTMAQLSTPSRVFICASAIGYYGSRGDELLTENSTQGTGFLAEVVKDWETATRSAEDAGVRVVNTRFGVVMDPSDAGLRKMLPFFRLGLGGRLGSGRQYLSWVTLKDVTRAVEFVMTNEELTGPVNIVSPGVVTNREFTRVLAGVLHRPAILPVPSFALKAVFGRMAEDTLLANTRVRPEKLLRAGYEFSHPELRAALGELLR